MLGRNFSGRSQRRGMGFGFRGTSPPPPYTGMGRGGLPRCSYYAKGNVSRPAAVQTNREDELSYLRDQAKTAKSRLDEIECRIRDLEAGI